MFFVQKNAVHLKYRSCSPCRGGSCKFKNGFVAFFLLGLRICRVWGAESNGEQSEINMKGGSWDPCHLAPEHWISVTSLKYPKRDVTSLNYPKGDVTSLSYPERDVTSLSYSKRDVTSLSYLKKDVTLLSYSKRDSGKMCSSVLLHYHGDKGSPRQHHMTDTKSCCFCQLWILRTARKTYCNHYKASV